MKIPLHQVTTGDSVVEEHQLGGSLLPESLHASSLDLILLLTDDLQCLAAGGRLAPLNAVLHVLHDVLHPDVRVLKTRGQEVNTLASLILHTYPLRMLPNQGAGAQPSRPPGPLASSEQNVEFKKQFVKPGPQTLSPKPKTKGTWADTKIIGLP